MSVFDRGVRGNVQNPFAVSGDSGSVSYTNPRMPTNFNGNVGLALDYLLDGMYPNYKGTVNTPADLPTNAQKNDLYLVRDDGDGKSAGYVYSVVQGATQWVKRYDVDWSYDQILADTITRTSYMYAAKYGVTDKDATGAAVTGQYAGQRIFGGDQTGQNMTLTANVVDSTGVIQFSNTLLPTVSGALDLGSTSFKFGNVFASVQILAGTATLKSGSLVDSGGALSFGSNNLSTTGTLSAGVSTLGNTTVATTLSFQSGKIVDSGGALSFQANNLSTTGTITAAASSKLADITFTNGTFATGSTVFSFSNQNVAGIGTLTSSKVVTSEVDVANLVLSGQTLTTNAAATALILQAGTGGTSTTVQVNSAAQLNFTLGVSGAATFAATVQATGAVTSGTAAKVSTNATNARFESLSGDLQLVPTGNVSVFSNFLPDQTAMRDLGSTALRFRNQYLSGSIGDGTNQITMPTLLTLRNINTNAQSGYYLTYDGTNWGATAPMTSIDHRSLTNLTTGDAGHTQFALLAGRSGGQTLQGGTGSGENLILDSTSNAVKGLIQVTAPIVPTSSGNAGIGTSALRFKDFYGTGIFYGLRIEPFSGSANYPANSAGNTGRLIYDSATNQLALDSGTAWVKVGQQKYISDVSFDGSTASKIVDVSASISDARTAVWQLADNTNGFEKIQAKLTFTQTQVTIAASPPLPSGSYRLIGLN